MSAPRGPVPGPRRLAPPVNRPDGFAPAYDGFEPRFVAGTDVLTLVIYGIENRGGDAAALKCQLLDAFEKPDGPDVLEHGMVRPEYGPPSELWFAYWRDAAAHSRWTGAAGIDALWDDLRHLDGPVGLWREYCLISLDHNETSSSRPDELGGIAAIADAMGTTEIHGYWGSARDRMAAAATDPLTSQPIDTASEACATFGRRVRIVAPDNVCLIRTSQDVSGADPAQLDWYRRNVEPALLAGLRYLREQSEESGCLDARFVDEIDAEGRRLSRSCAVAYFSSLAALEAWVHHHATHAQIMTSFLGMVERFAGNPGIHLWHEVTVFPAGHLAGDYINCSPETGLLRLAASTTPMFDPLDRT